MLSHPGTTLQRKISMVSIYKGCRKAVLYSTHFFGKEVGAWCVETLGEGELLRLECVGASMTLDEVYEDVPG